jgi:hypothetical protein
MNNPIVSVMPIAQREARNSINKVVQDIAARISQAGREGVIARSASRNAPTSGSVPIVIRHQLS